VKKGFCLVLGSLAVIAAGSTARAQIIDEVIEYPHGDVTCAGRLYYDSNLPLPLPGVLIFHQWAGPGHYEEARAKMLAALGYAAFVADLYSKEVRPETNEDRGRTAGMFKEDRALTRARARAALDAFMLKPQVSSNRIVSIGYCFGGMASLELARSGAPLAGAASIHGNLNTPDPGLASNITCAVFVQHGAADPFVTDEEVETFRVEMEDGGVEYRLIAYENAVHAFTDWNAGSDVSRGAAYDAEADKASWEDLLIFLREKTKPADPAGSTPAP